MGLGKVSRDDLIDTRSALGWAAVGGRPEVIRTCIHQFSEGSPARLEFMLEPEQRSGNRARLGTSQPDNSNATAARRRSDSDNGVIQVHR